ncbi:MAG: hypothetical protein O3B01_12835 [Planctomycetota bacterium]|nr:hypothetical protein [Planctomycetota bacterium]MDA1139462.1 hypothetical protein [Planctomycetota bacterium]
MKSIVAIFLLLTSTSYCEDKRLGPPAEPLKGRYWDQAFLPTAAYGSYNSFIKRPDGKLELWNNTIGDGPEDGLARFIGTSPTEWGAPEIVVPHNIINDVFDKDGKPSVIRRYTRPSVLYHEKDGYFLVPHVSDGYPPRQGSVYPALIASKTGNPGSWVYHGKLRGEIEEFWPGKNSRWADGRGLFYQPDFTELNTKEPTKNRFLFFSNQYPGQGCLALLYSADGKEWHFYRSEGNIVNLLPEPLRTRSMIFPHVMRAGKHGWYAWISEKWPPEAIWRIHSMDGMTWKLFGEQPEVVRPKDVTIKTLCAWYDETADLLHGYVSVWEKVGDDINYRLYHSSSRQFSIGSD